MTININQFSQSPIRGQLDLGITNSGILQGRVSASQATALAAGDRVKLDTAAGKVPMFVAAAVTDVAIGVVVHDTKKSAPVAGDEIQVALLLKGPVMWVTAGDTITAQLAVEYKTDGTVQTLGTSKQVGYMIDPGVATDTLRMIITNA